MSVIIDDFLRFLFILFKIDLGSFYSSKIVRRIQIWALEKRKLSRISQIIEQELHMICRADKC